MSEGSDAEDENECRLCKKEVNDNYVGCDELCNGWFYLQCVPLNTKHKKVLK